jgi:hypothetical protein
VTGRHEREVGATAGDDDARQTVGALPGVVAEDGDREPEGFGFRILPAGWMRGLLVTVTAVLTVVIALSDLTSAWVLVALPGAVLLAVAYLEALDRITRP